MIFNVFCSHSTNIHIFGNSCSVEVSDNPGKLQLEITEMQYDSIFHSNINQEAANYLSCLVLWVK